jgi:signal transduction histidine kinase
LWVPLLKLEPTLLDSGASSVGAALAPQALSKNTSKTRRLKVGRIFINSQGETSGRNNLLKGLDDSLDQRCGVTGDHDAIKQVLLIIMDNALKHSAGEIKLTDNRSGNWCEIRVQDFGEGIAPEKLEHVFDRFYRGEETSTVPGFGLGLPIARTLTEGQDGEITMESKVGKGSTVVLRLPVGGESAARR